MFAPGPPHVDCCAHITPPPQKKKVYKISCFLPKLLSLAKGINKEAPEDAANCLVGQHGVGRLRGDSLSYGTPHVCLGRASRGHGPHYPPLGNVHLSPHGITYLISHKTCMTSKACMSQMRWNIFQSVKNHFSPRDSSPGFLHSFYPRFLLSPEKNLWFLWFVH